MTIQKTIRMTALGGLILSLAACGQGIAWNQKNAPEGGYRDVASESHISGDVGTEVRTDPADRGARSTLFDLFKNNDDPNVTVEVNKYIWQASLEVLDFLPIQSVDPFTGVIVTGYGTPPGGGRAYRATIHVTDPALDARSLKVSLESRGGAVSAQTVQAVEDAILTRARQIRVADSKL
ncbi:DUF3576 domain-containing protein [Thioclava sp. GXIMD2076]|uniref:DUF3576 domain-containing protein n=1 Tax=Thioclava kandeliae TaxID=3070818 RepID=A0ABV1SKZ7_9RHOB